MGTGNQLPGARVSEPAARELLHDSGLSLGPRGHWDVDRQDSAIKAIYPSSSRGVVRGEREQSLERHLRG